MKLKIEMKTNQFIVNINKTYYRKLNLIASFQFYKCISRGRRTSESVRANKSNIYIYIYIYILRNNEKKSKYRGIISNCTFEFHNPKNK